jgi:histidinol phosphatase-like PHP family hydrolase
VTANSLPASTPTNGELSRLLGIAAGEATGHLAQALRRASRRALGWPEEAAALHAAGRSLTELDGIGPVLAEMLTRWVEDPEQRPDQGSAPQPDPLRSGFLTLAEVRAALAGAPELRRPRGDLQMHTVWSDGGGSVADMLAAAAERGYEFLAITDHSKTLKIAGGMDEETLAAQGTEIDRVQEEADRAGPGAPEILRSVELNLDPEGRGDMDPAALARLDVVLGSFHSALRLTSDQTDRYLAALRNPDLHILGHPRGRMYGRRAGLVADWDRVFAEAARLGKAVEVDAFPDRQDLDVTLLRRANEAGALISIGSDSHMPGQLPYLEYGLGAAALAGVPPSRILNFWSAAELRSWAAALRAGEAAHAPTPGEAAHAATPGDPAHAPTPGEPAHAARRGDRS